MSTNTDVGANNLRHVLEANCEDPDCEIHTIEVGIQETTLNLTHLAIFLAGAERVLMGGYNAYNDVATFAATQLEKGHGG